MGSDFAADWQSQVDEVLALTSIYEDDFTLTTTTIDGAADPESQGLFDAEALLELLEPQSKWVLQAELAVHCALPSTGFTLLLGHPKTAHTEADNPSQVGPAKGTQTKEDGNNADDLIVRQQQQNQEDSGEGTSQPACRKEQYDVQERQPEETESGPSSPSTTEYSIAHLPPLMLRLTFQPGYPSSQPPLASISSLWLTHQQTQSLLHQLQVLWEDQGPGLPVSYSWVDWLQHHSLEFLGLTEGLFLQQRVLVPSGDGEEGEAAYLCSSPELAELLESGAGGSEAGALGIEPRVESAETQLLTLLRYNAARDYQLFQRGLHTCTICFEEQHGGSFIRLDCGHYFCKDCLTGLAKTHVTAGSVEAIKCPEPNCARPLEPHILRLLLSDEDFARWDQLTLQRALDSMADTCYCPRCGAVALEDEDSHAACPKCLFDFCALCEEARHPGVNCVNAETKLEMLRRKAEGGGAAAVAELRRKEQDYMSLAVIQKYAKPCPRCGIAIERTQGCNKMTCANCNAYFCFKCGKEISGYDHYQEGSECILFDEAEILRWERQWQGEMERHMAAGFRNDFYGQLAAQEFQLQQAQFENAAAGGGGGGGQRRGRRQQLQVAQHQAANCPQCGQLNYKIARNNHMQCWSCTRHFCAVCRMVLQGRGGNHFRPGGCKQHS